ncbi:hypothetical protein MMC25_007753 [Agyrium rufum]|nr:hypothetical protein [Agyrium rufum]
MCQIHTISIHLCRKHAYWLRTTDPSNDDTKQGFHHQYQDHWRCFEDRLFGRYGTETLGNDPDHTLFYDMHKASSSEILHTRETECESCDPLCAQILRQTKAAQEGIYAEEKREWDFEQRGRASEVLRRRAEGYMELWREREPEEYAASLVAKGQPVPEYIERLVRERMGAGTGSVGVSSDGAPGMEDLSFSPPLSPMTTTTKMAAAAAGTPSGPVWDPPKGPKAMRLWEPSAWYYKDGRWWLKKTAERGNV